MYQFIHIETYAREASTKTPTKAKASTPQGRLAALGGANVRRAWTHSRRRTARAQRAKPASAMSLPRRCATMTIATTSRHRSRPPSGGRPGGHARHHSGNRAPQRRGKRAHRPRPAQRHACAARRRCVVSASPRGLGPQGVRAMGKSHGEVASKEVRRQLARGASAR